MVIFYGEELLAPRTAPKLEDHPLSAVYDGLFSVFAATLHIRRPFLHPQPEDAPCHGDRDPLIMVCVLIISVNQLYISRNKEKQVEPNSDCLRITYSPIFMQRLVLQPVPNVIDIHRLTSETKHANQQTDKHAVGIMLSLHVLCSSNALKLDDLLSALKEMSS
jgi:hypothetical protein